MATATPPIYIGTPASPLATVNDLTTAIDLASGVQKTINSDEVATISLSSGTAGNVPPAFSP